MADGVHTCQWDAEGRMIQLDSGANAINDTFNAFGWRVYTTYPSIPATNYFYDPQGKFLVGYFGNWNAPVPFQGRTLAMYTEGAGSPLFFDHPNALGSEGQWTNTSGGYGGELQFYPWGQEGPNTTNGNVYQYYAGLLLYDPQSDGYQTNTRYFIPRHGRWLRPDPIGKGAVRLDDPQTWNMYVYVRDNPTSRIDPTGLDDITYDQSGNEINRKKRGFWHNLLFGDTWKLQADNGNTYKLDDALRPLENGQKYTLVSQQQTVGMLANFLAKNATAPGGSGAGPATVLSNSPTGQAWDFKDTSDVKSLGPALFLYTDNNLYHADYVGNMAWGFIMASNGWPETVSKAGAGLYQLKEAMHGPVAAGPAWSFYDDPRDTEAIGRGYDLWNNSVRTSPDDPLINFLPE